MGRLSTHVLDTAQGVPGQGVSVKLFSLDGRELITVESLRTGIVAPGAAGDA